MSAIAAIFHRDGEPVRRTDVEQMIARLAHRGPDTSAVWHRDAVSLGHAALWTTPEARYERQPVVVGGGDFALTADIRLDNCDELLSALGRRPRDSVSVGDGELLIAAYRRWGENCLDRLIGDFVFAIWDDRRRCFFCARDHMGTRPLYYCQTARKFALASEIKALRCLEWVPARLNEARVASYLLRDFTDEAATFFEDVLCLPAGHCLTVSADGVQLRRYWSPDLKRELSLKSDGEYAEALRTTFAEAVRCRLRSTHPVGAALSGGLDSSSIACVARDSLQAEGGESLHTFSAVFPRLAALDPRIDERRYIEAVLATGGFVPHRVEVDGLTPLVDTHWRGDQVIPAPNLYIDEALFQVAQQNGVRVFLSGIDGDSTLWHGEEYLSELARTGRWLPLVRELSAIAGVSRARLRQVAREFVIKPLVPEPLARLWRLLHRRHSPDWHVIRTLKPDFARRFDFSERVSLNRQSPRGRVAHWRGLSSGLLSYAVATFDQVAAPFGIEVRYPFCDRRLIELCLAFPPEQKLRHGLTRWAMRQAMAGILPPEVQMRRSKANLSASFRCNLFDHERSMLDDVIVRDPGAIGSFIAVPVLREAYARYSSDPRGSAVDDDAVTVFLAVILAQWLRHVDFSGSVARWHHSSEC